MYWKIDQRLPVDGASGPSSLQGGRAPVRSNDKAFADMLASRLDTGPSIASHASQPLSSAFVAWLTRTTPPPASVTPATTMDWMTGIAPSSPPQATATPDAKAVSPSISALIKQAASRYQLDPKLISSVIAQESSFDPHAISVDGAQGLMQLMPETAHELKVSNAFDPAQNIDGGSRYLSGLIKRYHGDVKLALAAYNWGMGNLERQPHKMPAETRHYVASIMQRWQGNAADRLA